MPFKKYQTNGHMSCVYVILYFVKNINLPHYLSHIVYLVLLNVSFRMQSIFSFLVRFNLKKMNPVDQTLYLFYQETWFLWYSYFNRTHIFRVHANV
jgi:hypothetical protein